jgi:hypothetical protein
MSVKDKNVVVTGGSRGLGLGLVEALVAHGAHVTVVARSTGALDSVRARLGVATISADVTDEAAAHRILGQVRPEILVLNAGAKRTLWIMARYANGISEQNGLGIRFQTIVPLQIIGDTGVGDAGANAYARAMGIKRDAFLARFGAPMPPREFGEKVVSVLNEPKYAEGFAFGLKGDTGITMLEGAAA